MKITYYFALVRYTRKDKSKNSHVITPSNPSYGTKPLPEPMLTYWVLLQLPEGTQATIFYDVFENAIMKRLPHLPTDNERLQFDISLRFDARSRRITSI